MHYPIIKEFKDSDGELWEIRREGMDGYVHIAWYEEPPCSNIRNEKSLLGIPVEDIPKLIEALEAIR